MPTVLMMLGMNEMNRLISIAGRAIVNVSSGFTSRSMKFQKPIPITFPRETQGRLRKLFINTLIILYQNGEDFRREKMGKYHKEFHQHTAKIDHLL